MAASPSSPTTALHVHINSIVTIKSSWIGAWPFVKLVRPSRCLLSMSSPPCASATDSNPKVCVFLMNIIIASIARLSYFLAIVTVKIARDWILAILPSSPFVRIMLSCSATQVCQNLSVTV